MNRASPAALPSPSIFPPAEVPLASHYCPSPICLILPLIVSLFFLCGYNASPSAVSLRILPVALPGPGPAAVRASIQPVSASAAAATVAAAPANASASGYRRESAFLGSIITAATAERWVMLQHFITSSTVLLVLLLLRSCMLRHLLLPAATPGSRLKCLYSSTGPASAAAVPAVLLQVFFISAVAVATVVKGGHHCCCRRPLRHVFVSSPSPLLAAPVSTSFSAPLSPVLSSGISVAAVSPHSLVASLRLGSASSTCCLPLPAAAAVSSRRATQRLYPVVPPCASPSAAPVRAAVLASPSGFAVSRASSSFSAAAKSSPCTAAAAASCDIAGPLSSESTSLLRSVLPLAAAAALSTSLLVAACRNGAEAALLRLTDTALSDAALSSGAAVLLCAAAATLFAKPPALRFSADAAGGHSTAAAPVFPTTATRVCAAAADTTRSAAAARSRPVAAANPPPAAVGASVCAASGLPPAAVAVLTPSAAAEVSTVSCDAAANSSEGWSRSCLQRRAAGPLSNSSTPQRTPRRRHLRRSVATAAPLHQGGAELAAAVAAANSTTAKIHSIHHAAAETFPGNLLPRLPRASLETSTGRGASTWWISAAAAAVEQKPVQQCLHYHPSCCLPDSSFFFPGEISQRSHPLCSKRRLCSAPASAVAPVPAVAAAAADLPALPVAAALGGAAVPDCAGVSRRAATPARAVPAGPAVAAARAVAAAAAAARMLIGAALAAVAALHTERTPAGLAAGCCSLLQRESSFSLEKKQRTVHNSSRRQDIFHPLCCVSNRQALFWSSTTAGRNGESAKVSFVGIHCTYIRSLPLVCCCCSSRFRVASSSRGEGCNNKREVREEKKAGKVNSSCMFGWRGSDCCFLRDNNSSRCLSSCSRDFFFDSSLARIRERGNSSSNSSRQAVCSITGYSERAVLCCDSKYFTRECSVRTALLPHKTWGHALFGSFTSCIHTSSTVSRLLRLNRQQTGLSPPSGCQVPCESFAAAAAAAACSSPLLYQAAATPQGPRTSYVTAGSVLVDTAAAAVPPPPLPVAAAAAAAASRGASEKACVEASWDCSSRTALSSSQGGCRLLPLAAAAAALPGRWTTVVLAPAAPAAAGSVGGLCGAPQRELHYRCEGKRGRLLQQLQRRGGRKKTQGASQYTTTINPLPPVWGAQQQQLVSDCENDAEAEWEEEHEEWGENDPLEGEEEYETPSNKFRETEDEAEWVAEDVHANAFEQLRELERIRDKELLMSWAEWGKAVGRSVEDLKSLVRMAYGIYPPPVPATAVPVLTAARAAAAPAGHAPATAAPCVWGSAAANVAADAAAADEQMVEMAAGAKAAEAVTTTDQAAKTRFAVQMRSEETGATGDGRSAGAGRPASVTEAAEASAADKVQETTGRSRDEYPEETAAEDGLIIPEGAHCRDPRRETERRDTRGRSSRRLEAAGAAEMRVSNDHLAQQGIKREAEESVDHDYPSEESVGDKNHIKDKAPAPGGVETFDAAGELQHQQQKQIERQQQQQDRRLHQIKQEWLPGQQPFQERLLQEQESHREFQAMCIPPLIEKQEVFSRQIATEEDQTNMWEDVRELTHECRGHFRSGRNSASALTRNSKSSRSEHPSQRRRREEVKYNYPELQKGEHASFTQGSGMSATNAIAEDTSCVSRPQCVPPAAGAIPARAAALQKEPSTTLSSETPAAASAVCGRAVSPRVAAGSAPPARHVGQPSDRRKQQPQQLRMKLQGKAPASSGRKQHKKINRTLEKKEREQEASAGLSRGRSTLASLLLSPEEYRELLSLSRVEAVHAALEGAANEEEVFIVPQEGEAESEEEEIETYDYADLLEQETSKAASVEEGGVYGARRYGPARTATAARVLPRDEANERCLLRPPTVDEWAAAVTAGDVEELNRRLERGRALLERCLRRLQPLAQAAVQRFRAANKLAALLRQQLREQGDYEAVKAFLAKGTEEELELLLVALQGIRQGLRRHARTALRRSVRLRRAKQNQLQQQQQQQKLLQQQQAMQQQQRRYQKLQRQQEEMQQEQQDTQRPKIEEHISKDSVPERSGTRSHQSSSFEKLCSASQRDHKTDATNDTRIGEEDEEEEEREGEEEEEEEEEILLEPPPSVAYWMWMRTAMAEWEQQKRQVSQFPWRWWREAARGRKAAHILYQELGREPTQDEVAEKIGVPLDRWNDITLATKAAISTETELSGAGGLPGLKLGGGAAETGDRRDTVGDFLVSEDLGQEGEQASLREDLETHVLDLAAQALDSSEYRMLEKLLAVSHSSGVHTGGPSREEGAAAPERVVSGVKEREEVSQGEGNGQTDGDKTRNHSLQLQNDASAHSETAKVHNNKKRTRVDQQTRRRLQGAQRGREEKNTEQQQKAVGGEKQKIQVKEVVNEGRFFQQQQGEEHQCDQQTGGATKQKRTLDHNEENFCNIRRVLVDFMNDKVSARLQGVIEKMKEFEVKRILANLSPQEKADGLQNPEALEAVVQRKSAVLQLCLSANTMQGIEQ